MTAKTLLMTAKELHQGTTNDRQDTTRQVTTNVTRQRAKRRGSEFIGGERRPRHY